MCIFSSCGQIVFGIVMVLCLIMTAISTFDGKLLSWDCLSHSHRCNPWERTHIESVRAMAIFMCLAIIFEMTCLLWNLITFCACCWKKYIIHPLVLLSFITTVLLFIAVIIYTAAHQHSIGYYEKDVSNQYDYSFWLAVSAVVFAGIDTVVAALTVCLGKRGL